MVLIPLDLQLLIEFWQTNLGDRSNVDKLLEGVFKRNVTEIDSQQNSTYVRERPYERTFRATQQRRMGYVLACRHDTAR